MRFGTMTRIFLFVIVVISTVILSIYILNRADESLVRHMQWPTDNGPLNKRPVIGLLAQVTHWPFEPYGDSFMYSSYVKFLMSAGAQVVPIRIRESEQYYLDLLDQLNGVVLPGGGADVINSYYANTTRLILDYAIKAHARGDHFPVLGVCLGLEVVATHATGPGGRTILTHMDTQNLVTTLHPAPDFATSKMFKNLPKDLQQVMFTEKLLVHTHQYGITVQSYNQSPRLQQKYKLLVSDTDRKGVEFVSALESHTYPIYLTQFHPEKLLYTHFVREVEDTYHGSRVMAYFANFFVNDARRSQHTFLTNDLLNSLTINNYAETSLRGEPLHWSFDTIYVFNFTKHSEV